MAKRRARLDWRAKQQAEANASGMVPLTEELSERLDLLRADEALRRSLARRVQPDRRRIAAQTLKQAWSTPV